MSNFYTDGIQLRIKTPLIVFSPEDALALSIEKWQFIVDQFSSGNIILMGLGGSTCGLCAYYYENTGEVGNCGECPVKRATGLDQCLGSPYGLYLDVPTRQHAQAELDFLKGLQDEQAN